MNTSTSTTTTNNNSITTNNMSKLCFLSKLQIIVLAAPAQPIFPTLEMCAGQNLQERERKETRSRLKKIFLVPVFFRFFSFLERVFPLFPIFLGISHPVLRRSFPVFSSFHLSKPVPWFFDGPKIGHFGTGFERKSL